MQFDTLLEKQVVQTVVQRVRHILANCVYFITNIDFLTVDLNLKEKRKRGCLWNMTLNSVSVNDVHFVECTRSQMTLNFFLYRLDNSSKETTPFNQIFGGYIRTEGKTVCNLKFISFIIIFKYNNGVNGVINVNCSNRYLSTSFV